MQSNHTIPLDLNHDGIIDFAIQCSVESSHAILRLRSSNANEVSASYTGSFGTEGAVALHAGRSISSNSNFRTESAGLMVHFEGTRGGEGSYYSFGHWRNVRNRYLGLKFFVKGKAHYGWARLNVKAHAYGKGDLIITGERRGKRYRLTNSGIAKARQIAQDLIALVP